MSPVRRTLLALAVVVPAFLAAQQEVDSLSGRPRARVPRGRGDVRITTSERIDALLEDARSRKFPQQGYRVQIFLGDRTSAETTKRAFLQKHPDIPAYLSWLAPNFRLRVGDLRTRLEAEHLLRDMKLLYPGSYIVPDEIEMPRIDLPSGSATNRGR